MGSLFSLGFGKVREAKKKQDEQRENAGKNLFRFFLQNDRDEAQIRFLTAEPVNFYEHNVKGIGNKFSTKICIGEDCPRCAQSDKPSFKSAWVIHDMRPFSYRTQDGKERSFPNGAIRLFVFGTKVSSVLDRLNTKYGLLNRVYTIIRDGKGQQTTYSFERGSEDSGLSSKEIINLLPDTVKPLYDGTEESLKKMIKDQLEREADIVSGEEPLEDAELPWEEDQRSKTVSIDDDEEKTDDEKPAARKGMFKRAG